jgi:hypothetical protein
MDHLFLVSLCIILVVEVSVGHMNTTGGYVISGPKGEKGNYGHPGIRGMRVMHYSEAKCRICIFHPDLITMTMDV